MSPTLDDPNRKRKSLQEGLEQHGPLIPFSPWLAEKIGVGDALLLIQIEIWIDNLSFKVKEFEGVKWLNLSAQEMHKYGFEHISRQKINKTIERLVKRGLVRVTYLPDFRAKWLALDYDKIEALGLELTPVTQESLIEPMSPARRRKAMALLGQRIKKEQEAKKRAKSQEHTDFPEF